MEIGAIGDAAIVRISEVIDIASAPRLEHVVKIVELSEARRRIFEITGIANEPYIFGSVEGALAGAT